MSRQHHLRSLRWQEDQCNRRGCPRESRVNRRAQRKRDQRSTFKAEVGKATGQPQAGQRTQPKKARRLRNRGLDANGQATHCAKRQGLCHRQPLQGFKRHPSLGYHQCKTPSLARRLSWARWSAAAECMCSAREGMAPTKTEDSFAALPVLTLHVLARCATSTVNAVGHDWGDEVALGLLAQKLNSRGGLQGGGTRWAGGRGSGPSRSRE